MDIDSARWRSLGNKNVLRETYLATFDIITFNHYHLRNAERHKVPLSYSVIVIELLLWFPQEPCYWKKRTHSLIPPLWSQPGYNDTLSGMTQWNIFYRHTLPPFEFSWDMHLLLLIGRIKSHTVCLWLPSFWFWLLNKSKPFVLEWQNQSFRNEMLFRHEIQMYTSI